MKDAIGNLEVAARLSPEKSYVQYVQYQLGRAYLAAGRKAEGENHLEISRQLKEKERQQMSSQQATVHNVSHAKDRTARPSRQIHRSLDPHRQAWPTAKLRLS